MKKLITYFLLSFYISISFGQIKNGSHVLTSTIGNLGFAVSNSKTSSTINPTQTGNEKSFGFRPELTYGIVKNNYLLSYGLSLSVAFATQSNTASGGFTTKSHLIGFGPVISYERFFPLLEKLCYTPFANLSLGYQYSKVNGNSSSSGYVQKSILTSFSFNPFSLTFLKNSKTNYLFMLGNVGIDYDRTKSFYVPTLYNGKTISNNLNLNASISGFVAFGIQKLF